MRSIVLAFYTIFLCFTSFSQVGIGTVDVDQSAILHLESTSKGFLPPRMTANEKLAIDNPETGLIIYCTNCCDNGRFNLYNGSLWVSINPCPDIDFDGDGVNNLIDVDDDNDGILDVDEGSQQFVESNPTSLTQVSGTGISTDVEVNDVYVYNDFLNIDGQVYDLVTKILEISLGANTSDDTYRIGLNGTAGVPTINYNSIEAVESDFCRLQYSFIISNSISMTNPEGVLANIPDVSATISDIESAPGRDVSEIGGIGRGKLVNGTLLDPTHVFSVSPTPMSLIGGVFVNSTPESTALTADANSANNITLVTMRKDLEGDVNNWTDEGTVANTSIDPNVEFQYDSIASIEMIFGVTGSENGASSRGMSFKIGSVFNIDTDSEGNEDFRDYDSDNDGCLDALEGDGGFTSSDINPTGQLLGQVGPNGLPLIAGFGQGVGDSQTISSCP